MPDIPQAPPDTSLTPTARDLTTLNTLGLQSRAPAFVCLRSPAQLPALSDLADRYASLLVLGGGSNLVLPPQVEGLVAQVALAGVRLVEARPHAWIIEAGAGENWHGLVSACVANGWGGLENLALIPGTVGAAPVQNIGAYGVELADRFLGLTAWNGGRRRLGDKGAAACRCASRDSSFRHGAPGGWVIIAVRFALPRPWRPVLGSPDPQRRAAAMGPAPSPREIYEAVWSIRRAKLRD